MNNFVLMCVEYILILFCVYVFYVSVWIHVV